MEERENQKRFLLPAPLLRVAGLSVPCVPGVGGLGAFFKVRFLFPAHPNECTTQTAVLSGSTSAQFGSSEATTGMNF